MAQPNYRMHRRRRSEVLGLHSGPSSRPGKAGRSAAKSRECMKHNGQRIRSRMLLEKRIGMLSFSARLASAAPAVAGACDGQVRGELWGAVKTEGFVVVDDEPGLDDCLAS
jgi:hypothetical protein